jgi:sugar phosphate isomerase/epimerase
MIARRHFLFAPLALPLATRVLHGETLPLKFGHRQANMVKAPGPGVFELARRIPGLSGVELQMIWKGQDLSERNTALDYKREANRWAMEVPSVAGIWKRGDSIFNSSLAENTVLGAIRSAELLGASVILMALFKPNCPEMEEEGSAEPVVSLFRKLAPKAAEAGVTLGLETSLSPADDKKLIDMVGHQNVKIYYDATNVETNHPGQSVPGIELLGPRIIQCHLKNQDRLLNQQPSKVDWAAALKAYRRIGYNGWYVFETAHSSSEQCVEATQRNIQFVTQCNHQSNV